MRNSTAQPAPTSTRSHPYARFVAGRRSKWVVLAFWVLLISIGGTLGAKLGTVQNNEPVSWLPANAQSTQAVKVGEEHFADKNISEAVIVYARDGGLTAADLGKVNGDRSRLTAERAAVQTIPQPAVSSDKESAFLTVPLRSSKNDNAVLGDAVDKVDKIVKGGAPSGLEIRVGGQAGTLSDYMDVYSGMDGVLLGVALLLVAVVLLVTYRSPVLWFIPLLSVLLASQVASGVVYVLGKYGGLHVDGYGTYLLIILTIGVGTDYALLLIARYREELRRHEDRHEAMALAVTRSLPAIAASAGTVTIAALCLLFASMNSTRGLGPVVAVGVVAVFLAMVSLLPALLVVFGRWVFWPFVPRHAPDHEENAEKGHGSWARVAQAVGRRPRAIWIGSAVVLVALAFGSTGLQTGLTQSEQFTKTVDSVAGQKLLAHHFPAGSSAPIDVYVPSGGAATALATVERVPGVTSAKAVASAGGWTHISAVPGSAPDSQGARQTVERMRTALAGSSASAHEAVVGGQTAVDLDTSNAEAKEEKLLIPLILGVVLIMLIGLLRALVAPVVLLLSVALSYAAAIGTAVLLFNALGHPRIDRNLLLFGFLFLVALGVDYTIFLMTRAREEVQRRGHREGVLTGLTVTGGVITSAGLVLAATFSVLAVLPTVGSLQQGLLVAVGLLLDTFIVRSLLIPALALDMGPITWWPYRPGGRPTTEAAAPSSLTEASVS
ncbi:MMPL family transporter [Streptomyces sp. NPDC101151]|uniref:MMPL family transporter n=1 Tax=Streptomyces sp. NPDC101151 TaxID=3366115 RepID=UPI00381C3748